MKTILWIDPSDCETLYKQIDHYDETIKPIRLTYTSCSTYAQAIILNYDTFKWLKAVGCITVC